jgi:F0F1-type ATP synthase delta subunit
MKPFVLPNNIYSPDQVSTVVLDLNTFQGELRDDQARAKIKSKKTEAPEPTALLRDVLDAAGLDNPTPDALDELRKLLENMLAKAPVAHVTLAALPKLPIKTKFAAWFRQEISPNMLLTFAVRTDIGGGAVVQTGSHVYDFSFRNLLMANKAKLAEIAARV